MPSNLVPRGRPSHRGAAINGKRKQPASDTNDVFGMNATMSSLSQGMQPQQTDQDQLQPDGHDQQQQLHQQLPLEQQCLGHSQGCGAQSQGASAVWTADLGRVVAWCFNVLVEKHLLAELQVGCGNCNQCCCCACGWSVGKMQCETSSHILRTCLD